MPRVKIDYVVSFSNEDPENQASNLLSWDVNKKKWLCSPGEPTCSAVLQLTRAVKISSIQIGVHHAAMVEVLVGRSETPSEPFQVLVPRCVFVSPSEARGPAGVERVRSFSGAALAASAAQRWDRLRLVCSQPYNKHCKYGISFIHIFEPDGESAPGSSPSPSPAPPPLQTYSSDEDEDFRPGELFTKHRQSGPGDTGAQIRQATSQALKKNPDAAIKLMKTSLTKNKPAVGADAGSDVTTPRPRDKQVLMYTEDDERPHAKIDNILQRHKDGKSQDEAKSPKPNEKVKKNDKADKTPRSKREEPPSRGNSGNKKDYDKTDSRIEREDGSGASSSRKKDESRKRSHSEIGSVGPGEEVSQMGAESVESGESSAPLQGVVLVLSGYQNPQRAELRRLALALGARVQKDWGPDCTHLLCAFSKTPKLSALRSARATALTPAPTAAWLQQCARRRRRLPWRWFAAEPHLRLAPSTPPDDADECDTDDEIETVRRQQKKARTSPSPAPRTTPLPPGGDDDSDEVEFVKDERVQGNITVSDSESGGDTDVEGERGLAGRGQPAGRGELPPLLAGRALVLAGELTAPLDARLLARYCIAYGGLVLAPSEVEEGEGAECVVLCGSEGEAGAPSGALAGAPRVRAQWLWACHQQAKLLPLEPYLLP